MMLQCLLDILGPIVAIFDGECAEVFLTWTYEGDDEDDEEFDEKVGGSLNTLVRSDAEAVVPTLKSMFGELGMEFSL